MKQSLPEKYRLKGIGSNGIFIIPHQNIVYYFYFVIISDGMDWQHVSVSLRKKDKNKIKPVERCATWLEMCYIKSLFWEDEEAVLQFHPPKSQYVSTHPYCLHLWMPINFKIQLPDPIMVGFVGDNNQTLIK